VNCKHGLAVLFASSLRRHRTITVSDVEVAELLDGL